MSIETGGIDRMGFIGLVLWRLSSKGTLPRQKSPCGTALSRLSRKPHFYLRRSPVAIEADSSSVQFLCLSPWEIDNPCARVGLTQHLSEKEVDPLPCCNQARRPSAWQGSDETIVDRRGACGDGILQVTVMTAAVSTEIVATPISDASG